jgi:O-antigen ligase
MTRPIFAVRRLAGVPSSRQERLVVPAGIAINVVIALFVASAGGKAAALVLVAVAVVPLVWAMVARPTWVLYGALLLIMLGGTLNEHLPGTGGTRIFPPDVFVLLAAGGAVVRTLTRRGDDAPPRLRAIVLSWPFVLLAFALMYGVVRGHDRYGTSYLSQPLRIVVYAAIGLTLVTARPADLFRNLTRVFYITVVVSTVEALYYIATGTSQTQSADLSTGGTRILALSTAMFLAAGLVIALLQLDLDPHGPRRRLHLLMAALALFGIVISLGRTTFAAVGVIVPVLVIVLRRLRRAVVVYAPVVLVAALLATTFLAMLSPGTATTIGNRFTGKVGTDTAVIQRQRKYAAAMEGFGRDPVFGLGFGRPVTFVSIDRTVQTFSGDPENSYIYILAGGGIFALGALLLLIALYFVDVGRRFLRTAGEERALVVFGASLAFVLLVNALAGPVLSDPPLMLMTWIGLVLPAAAGRRVPVRSAPPPDRPARSA